MLVSDEDRGIGGGPSPADGNSAATVALPAFLACIGAALRTLGSTATLLPTFTAGFGSALGIVCQVAFTTTLLLCHFNSPGSFICGTGIGLI